jgi:class 3 adenylate cyclase
MNQQEFESSLLLNETVEATVVFIDICKFTSITEKEPADKVIKLLNRYFDVMVEGILAHGGYVDKFMGDAVMAIFKGEYHLDRAIETCLSVRKKIEALPVSDEFHFSPKVSIGLDSGEVISGNIGSASLRRLDYTVIGDVVNTAQRLQSAAQEGQIVINENAYLKISESFNCLKIGEIKLKNKLKPGILYEVLN